MRRCGIIVGRASVLVVLAGLIGCATEDEPIPVDRPRDTQALSAAIPGNSVYLFQDSGFKQDVVRVESVTAMPAGVVRELGRSRGVTSMRWHLDPGVLVVLYEHPGGTGNEVAIWGKGQVSSLSKWKSNDKLGYWAWYSVGGGASARLGTGVGMSPRPVGAMPTGPVAAATMEMYRDAYFKGTLTTIGPVTQYPVGGFERVGKAADKMTSVRWSLPAGVVVVLYEDAPGQGRQLALFGSGAYPSASAWNFNDKVSRWAWYYVGAEGRVTEGR